MDIYNLINSKAISEHCRKIQHQFNTEELAVLIYRNKRMSIDEKISAYQELISDYEDMEVIERINCKHYDNVKDMIKEEMQRLKDLRQEMQQQDENMIYTYETFYTSSQRFEESDNFYKTYDEVNLKIFQELKEDKGNEILMLRAIKRSYIRDERKIIEEYVVTNDRNLKLINIDDTSKYLDIDSICLNIPTPFKKGDILVSYANRPFNYGTLFNNAEYPFVLEWLCNWEDNLQKRLNKGCCDSSDMNGKGYMIFENDKLECDHQFDYDSWEYFNGELKGVQRILKAISSFLQGKISMNLLLETYKYILADKEVNNAFWYGFTDEGLKLAGLSDEDIKRIRN